MSSKLANQPSTKCVNLKAGLVPLTTLELTHLKKISDFEHELEKLVQQAPLFFQDTPVIMDLAGIPDLTPALLTQVVLTARRFGLIPIAFQKGNQEQSNWLSQLGLAHIKRYTNASNKKNNSQSDERQRNDSNAEKATKNLTFSQEPISQPLEKNLVITKPIRSGQQVCAPDGDLVILSQVSAGAEVLAAGDIHVYGALRGRALAGIKGNKNSQIFCQQLEAELISIAGIYQISLEFNRTPAWKKPIRACLEESHLHIQALS